MFHIERMQKNMRDEVIPMVQEFYHSDAVCHPVEQAVLERTFADAVSEGPVLEGWVLMEDEQIVGFGSRFFREIMERHREVVRFRLEVTRSNEAAVRLYERLGFTFLEYDQMVLDRQ